MIRKESCKMEVTIKEGCIGCELCASTCSEVFRMDDDGLAQVFAQPAASEQAAAQEAADGCPVNVIVVEN